MLVDIAFAALLAAAPLDFDEAKALADANEESLPKPLSAQLLQSQGDALGSAMAACAHPDMDLSSFAVVLSLNPDGSVAASWRKGETPLAKCVHKQLSKSGLAGQWPSPFYTSVAMSFNES